MRKLLLLGVLILAGCTGTGAIPPSTGLGLLSPLVDSGTISTSTRDKAKQVQAYAITACQFQPELASVISLVNAAAGIGVGAIGNALCNAVTSIPLADGGTRKIVVNGVRIKGRRIVTVLR